MLLLLFPFIFILIIILFALNKTNSDKGLIKECKQLQHIKYNYSSCIKFNHFYLK